MSVLTSLADRALARRSQRPTAPLEGQIVDRAPVPLSSRRGNVTLSALTSPATSVTTATRAMTSSGVLYAIVGRTSQAVAASEWHLYRRPARPGGEPREVTDHPALAVLDRPNAFTTRQELFEVGQQYGELCGETWWIIARSKSTGLPVELWPVRPDQMAVVPSATEFISGYTYTAPDGEKIPLPVRDVILMRVPNPADPYRGLGPVQSILPDLANSKAAAQWNERFFLNGALPGGIIEVGRRLSEPEFDEFAMRWREQHQGIANAHRAAILEHGQWKDVGSPSHRDMQFAELATLADERTRVAFGFPKPLLGSVDDVNRANAEAADVMFARHLIVPRLERIKGALNADFLPQFPGSEELFFDFVSPVPQDREADRADLDSRVRAAVALIDKGADPAATLKAFGLPALPFGARPAPAPGSVEALARAVNDLGTDLVNRGASW